MKLERIELSGTTQRQKRNLIASAFLIIILQGFAIEIDQFTAFGIETNNFSTIAVILTIFAIMLYSLVSFLLRAIEEFHFWKQGIAREQGGLIGGGDYNNTKGPGAEPDDGYWSMLTQLKKIEPDLAKLNNSLYQYINLDHKLSSNGLDIGTDGFQEIFDLARNAKACADGLKNTFRVMWWRFFVWEITVTMTIVLAAILFAFHPEMIGLFSKSL